MAEFNFERIIRRIIVITICILIVFILFSACTSATPTEPISATPTQTSTLTPTKTNTPEAPQSEGDEGATGNIPEQIRQTPTPAPTATPSALDYLISDLAENTGLNRVVVLNLTGEDWINLFISIVIILIGVTILTRVGYYLLQKLVTSTETELDDQLLATIGSQIRWLIWVLIIQFGTNRLLFLPSNIKQSLNQLYISLIIIISTIALWKLIDFAIALTEKSDTKDIRIPKLIIPFLRRIAHFSLIIVGATAILSNYGINVSAVIAVLGIGGLALSLAAQDTLADTISGFIILLDQPFREGDRIQIQGLDTWGDVIEIGARTTKIRTRDNRMVIVPNSIIGKSQIVNYTYPDPRYRVEIDIDIEEGVYIPNVRQIITDAVKNVEGVLQDKPVDALFINFGSGSLIFRVRWWLSSYADTRRMFDKVNEAIYNALNEAGISTPPQVVDVRMTSPPPNIQLDDSQPDQEPNDQLLDSEIDDSLN